MNKWVCTQRIHIKQNSLYVYVYDEYLRGYYVS
jgi:hypothetical protein